MENPQVNRGVNERVTRRQRTVAFRKRLDKLSELASETYGLIPDLTYVNTYHERLTKDVEREIEMLVEGLDALVYYIDQQREKGTL